ncbi:hypothetical protein K1719_019746 [Acacia pycnantha]|nr:hypothetical protein K1719_019746 [Acacia pycnantha]
MLLLPKPRFDSSQRGSIHVSKMLDEIYACNVHIHFTNPLKHVYLFQNELIALNLKGSFTASGSSRQHDMTRPKFRGGVK